MTATILPPYVPVPATTRSGRPAAAAATLYPGSVSGSSSAYSVSDGGETPSKASTTAASKTAATRNDGRKVDYAIALDLAKGTPLSRVLHTCVRDECLGQRGLAPHVNQTAYRPLEWQPIACSIETKKGNGGDDPIIQLGVWVAAWHKRMAYARQHVAAQVGGETMTTTTTTTTLDDRLPSVLLIEFVGHQWNLYMACETTDETDRGDTYESITLYGPISLGSTTGLLQLYQLLAALEAIKEWSETTFRQSLERWFMCDALVAAQLV